MKTDRAWWTLLAGVLPHRKIREIQDDARPKWHNPLTTGEPPLPGHPLLLLTDRNEICNGRAGAEGRLECYGLPRRGDDTEVNFVGFMYVKDLLQCAMPMPEKIVAGEGAKDAD